MNSGIRVVRPYLLAILFCLILGLYLATLTQVHTFDALSYVLSVERKPWTEVFHPHHLAYGPVGVIAFAAGQALGFTGGAALPMQLVNAVAGALGVALLFRVLLQSTDRLDLAVVLALVLGSSYAYWYYAVEIEVYTVATLLLIACLTFLIDPRIPSKRTMLLLGLTQGGAVLFHQTNLLLCVPMLVWWLAALIRSRSQLRRFLIGAMVYGVTLSLIVVLPYLWVGFGVSRFGSLDAFMTWMTEYARTGWWGGPLTWDKGSKLIKGLSETLTVGWGGYAWLMLAALGIAGSLKATLWKKPERHMTHTSATKRATQQPDNQTEYIEPPINPQLTLILLTWLLIYGGFFLWWEPDNIEFWIASLPPALLLLALGMRNFQSWGVATWLAFALVIALGVTNYDAIRRRGDATTDLQRSVARELAANSSTADLLIVPDGLQELYLPYYQQRENFISLNQALFDSDSNWETACSLIHSRIETARYAGASVLIAMEALHPPAELLIRHRLTQDQIDRCFAPFRAELRTVPLPQAIPPYLRLPAAQEYADGGWSFASSALGWRSANVSGERFENGWRMVPGSDPSLISPLLSIHTADVQAIEVVLANATQAHDAQLFFIGTDNQTNEAHSVHWELSPDPGAQTYRIRVTGQPGWQGIITRLRIDPVGVGDGGEIRVVAVRLVRER